MSYLSYLPSNISTTAAPAAITTEAQRKALAEYVRGLTNEGRHLEASTLYAIYFPLV
jgi:hypothetical protein